MKFPISTFMITSIFFLSAGTTLAADYYLVLGVSRDSPGRTGITLREPVDDTTGGTPLGGATSEPEEQRFNFKADYDSNTGLHAKIGSRPFDSSLRFELEYHRAKADIESFGNTETGQVYTRSADREQIFINSFYDFRELPLVPGWLSPFVGIGVGTSTLELDGNDDDSALVAKVGFGASFELTPAISLGLSREFYYADEYKLERGDQDLNVKFNGRTTLLELRYQFTNL